MDILRVAWFSFLILFSYCEKVYWDLYRGRNEQIATKKYSQHQAWCIHCSYREVNSNSNKLVVLPG